MKQFEQTENRNNSKNSQKRPANDLKRRIFIGVAWPYANGKLHLGHVAGSLLSPDIFSRYHKMKGDEVLMVSGSDEHGTPITVRAEKEGKTPQEVVDYFNSRTREDLEKLRIDFDLFSRTTNPNHIKQVRDVFLKLHNEGLIYPRVTSELFCIECNKFLPDRYVNGTCPHCGKEGARGDQCDNCSKTYEAVDLTKPKCKLCGSSPVARKTEHFFFRLSAFEEELEKFFRGKAHWKSRVLNFSKNWLKQGLKDRPITRDISWGVPVPLPGFDNKRIYVWFDAVIGYLSTSKLWAQEKGEPDKWKDFWLDKKSRAYYFLGKDNVPFHTIIWPSILLGYGKATGEIFNLPYDVPANEYLQLGGKKFTKSKGIGIDISSFMKEYNSDEVRYYLSIIMPENRDIDFSMKEFQTHINNELVATFGNYIHRVLSFTAKNFGNIPPIEKLTEKDSNVLVAIKEYEKRISQHIENCRFKNGIKEIMSLAGLGNRYLGERAPWHLIKTNREECGTVLNVGLRIVKALSVFAYPYLPNSMGKLLKYLGFETIPGWEESTEDFSEEQYSLVLEKPKPLYRKLEPETSKGKKAGATKGKDKNMTKGKCEEDKRGNSGKNSDDSKKIGKLEDMKTYEQLDKKNGEQPDRIKRQQSDAKNSNQTEKKIGNKSDRIKQEHSEKKNGKNNKIKNGVVDNMSEKKHRKKEKKSDVKLNNLDLRIGLVNEVKDHPNADRLYLISADVGEREHRTIIAGLKKYYKPEYLEGKSLVIVCNLKPAKLRGIKSNGMLLAASKKNKVHFLTPEKPVNPGTPVTGHLIDKTKITSQLNIDEFAEITMKIRRIEKAGEEEITLNTGTKLAPGILKGRQDEIKEYLVVEAEENLLSAGNILIIPEKEIGTGAKIR